LTPLTSAKGRTKLTRTRACPRLTLASGSQMCRGRHIVMVRGFYVSVSFPVSFGSVLTTCCPNGMRCCPNGSSCCPFSSWCCPFLRRDLRKLPGPGKTQVMHVELDCPWVSVSGGLRLLAPDGRSFRLRGATASADGHVEVPAKVAHHLYEAGVATEPCDLRVAVARDHCGSAALGARAHSPPPGRPAAPAVRVGALPRQLPSHWQMSCTPSCPR